MLHARSSIADRVIASRSNGAADVASIIARRPNEKVDALNEAAARAIGALEAASRAVLSENARVVCEDGGVDCAGRAVDWADGVTGQATRAVNDSRRTSGLHAPIDVKPKKWPPRKRGKFLPGGWQGALQDPGRREVSFFSPLYR
jgi:hypothetical protein